MKILRPAPRKQPAQLKNLGPVSTAWLASVGIHRRSDLIRLGPVEAFLRVKAAGHKPSLNLLWALAGAERGLRWNKLSEEDRHRLLLELDAAQAQRGKPAAKD
jgi:DNA transformation protein and related proteins